MPARGVSADRSPRCACVSVASAGLRGLLVAAAVGLGFGCGTFRPPAIPPDPATLSAAEVVPGPSPLLELVRSERELSELEYTPIVVSERDMRAAAADETEETDDEDDDGNVRHVLVRTTRLATWESLARAALRFAEHRRPREMHESRFLLRTAGAATTCEGTAAKKIAVRRLLRDSRLEVKRCLLAAETRRPDVLVKAPSALVVEQAMQRGNVVYEFDVHFPGGSEAPVVTDDRGVLDEEARECMAAVMEAGAPDDMPALDLPVVAFAQAATAFGGHPLNAGLANQAAALGWLHYDRGEFHEALAYFDDAYWIFHRVEYRVLVGMALEKLDRPDKAADAYAEYVAARADAPDALELRARIIKLRRT